MKIYHIERNYKLPLKEQKRRIKEQYKSVTEILCFVHRGIRYLEVFAD